MKNWLWLLAIALHFTISAQKYIPFNGKLTYKIELMQEGDSIFRPYSMTTIYTNDTLVRVDTETPHLGIQQLITHLQLHKSYLLINYNETKYAIQSHLKPDTVPSPYSFKKKSGKKTIHGMKVKRVLVNANFYKKPIEIWYFPVLNPHYLGVLKGIKGLPADYYLPTADGMLHYILDAVDLTPVKKDIFGIPSDYKKVSFDQFLQETIQGREDK